MRRAVSRRVLTGSSVSRRLLPSSSNKSTLKKCALSLAISSLILAETASAGPEGGQIVGGAGNINRSGNTTTINQNTERLAIDWQSFDVGSDERVNFVQPGSSSVALNRILSNYGSQINGRIDANGHVVLVNPNGIVFGAGSVINAGGILASGLSIDPADFMNGDYTFKALEGTDGVVINSGLINAATGGSVALIGQQVENQGLISAQLGSVTLAAGKEAVVTFDAAGLLGVRVSEAVLQEEIGVDAAVINSGEITAENGQILLSASVSEDIFSQAVNAGGLSDASSVVVHDDGSFTLGTGADVVNSGSVSTSGDNAGDIVVLGENITSSGRMTADSTSFNASVSEAGGRIEVHSQDTTLLTENSLTSATSNHGQGGDIKALGDKVGLSDQAVINASGGTGGGQVLVGGDRTGANPLIRNADFIYLGEHTNISADALLNGDGGRVITFANNTARIYGDLTARGGALGGNGGFIETSGLLGFEILNAPDISSVLGSGGEWLIDPHNITIDDDDTTPSLGGGPNFTASEDGTILDIADLRTALNTSATVTIQTANPAMGSIENGDITFNTALIYSGSSSTLVLNAHGNIDTGGNEISSSNNALNLQFNANFEGSAGDVILGNSTIDTNGGNFFIDSNGAVTSSGNISTNDGNGNSNFIFTAGDLTVNAASFSSTGSIDVSSFAGDGNINITTSGTTALNTIAIGERGNDDSDMGEVGSSRLLVDAQNINLNGSIAYGENGSTSTHNLTFDLSARDDINFNGINIDNDSGNDVLNITLAAGGDIAIQASDTQSNNISLTGGNFTVTSARNFTIGNATVPSDRRDFIGTEGGNITIGASGAAITGNFNSNFDNASLFTYINNGSDTSNSGDSSPGDSSDIRRTGDITIHADGDIILGRLDATALDFSNVNNWDYNGSDDVTITIAAGDDLTFHRNFNFERMIGTGTNIFNFSAGNAAIPAMPTADQLNSEIQVLANISSPDDVADITFTSNFTRPTSFILDGIVANTGAFTAPGSNLIIDLNNTVTLNGPIAINEITVRTDGLIQQTDVAGTLVNGGTAIFNTDRDNGGNPFDIILTGNNDFNSSSLIIEAANNVTLNDIDRLLIGGGSASTIFGNLVATSNAPSGQGIVDQGAVTVMGTASLIARGLTIELDQTNFMGEVNINTSGVSSPSENGGDVSITGSDSLTLGSVDTFGLDPDNNDAGNIAIIVSNNFTANGAIRANGTNSGNPGNITVNGNANNNTFTIGSGTTWSGGTFTINGLGGSGDTLVGPDQLAPAFNNWQITGANSGTLNSVFNFNTIENLTGGSGQDNFEFTNSSAALSGNVDGAGGVNDSVSFAATITNAVMVRLSEFLNIESFSGAANADSTIIADAGIVNSWTIDGVDSGDVNGIDFSNFDNLTGNALDDTFNFANGGSLSGTIDGAGESVNDTVSYAAVTAAVTANLDNFSNIEVVAGNAVAGTTLVGANSVNTWDIDGTNSGNVGGVTFSSFRNITGGSDDDSFVFNANGLGDIEGVIDGASQNNRDTVSYAAVTGAISVSRSDFTNIERVIGNNTNSTFQGENTVNTWTITGINDGNINGFEFINFNILTGGTLDDRFVFMTGGSIDSANAGAQTGEDIVDLSNLASVNITASTTIFDVSGFERVIGNNDGTGSNNSTLTATDSVNAWAITGVNDGNINGSFAFTDFNNLVGGTANDTFTISDGANITGTIDGAGTMDTDTVNFAAVAGAVSVRASDFTNIERVVGNNDNSTLIGANEVNTWTITGENDGDLNGFLFENFNHLTGGNSDDTFIFNGATSNLTGMVDAGSQASASGDTVDLSNLALVNISIDVADPATSTTIYGVTNAERVIGNNTSSRLNGADAVNTWTITGANSGDINGLLFEDFNILVGGDNDDTFVFMNDMSTVTSANAGMQNLRDTVDVSNIANVNVGVSNTIRGVSGVERVIGDNTTSVLTGGTTNTWTINATNAGSISDGVSTIEFQDFNQLVGGAGDDTFVFMDGGSITGTARSVDAAGQASRDTVDLSNLTSAIDEDVGSTIFGVTNVERVIGNNTNSTLRGADTDNTWNITAANSGNVNSSDLIFVNFNNLVGGSADDNFVFANNSSSVVSINGGGHTTGDEADYRNIDMMTVDLTLGTGIANIETLRGNGTDSFLRGQNITNTWTIDGTNQGNVNGINFFGFTDIVGGDRNDTFVFMTGGSIARTIAAGNQSSRDTVDVRNLTAANVVQTDTTVFGVSGVERVIGNNSDTTLVAANRANTWNINGQNDGTVINSNGALRFVNVSNLTGGSDDDDFTITSGSSVTGVINGRGQTSADSVTYQTSQDITLNTNLINIEQINAVDSTLRAANIDNNWLIDGTDTGEVNGIRFSGFNSLFGGDQDDTFVFTATGQISGSIDALGERTRDTVNLSALASVDITLGGNVQGVAGVERIIGNGNQSNLRAVNGDNTWQINDVNDGTVAGIAFEDFNNLFGGSGDDTFNFAVMGSITGTINGGGHTTQDTIDYSQVGAVDITVGDDFTEVERIVGNNINSRLTAADQTNAWNIDDVNEGTVNGLRFVDFNFLVGGGQQDNFTLAGGSITGSIDGAGNTDTLTADNSLNTWTITGVSEGAVTGVASFLNIDALVGNAGVDTFNVNNAFVGSISSLDGDDTFNLRADVSGPIQAGADNDQINIFVDGLTASVNGNGGTDTLAIRHAGASTWTIQGSGHTVDNVSFDGIEVANGNNAVDTVTISTDFGELNTQGGNDSFTIDTASAITSTLNAGSGNDTLTSLNRANDWLIGTDNTLNTNIAFTGMQTFVGGDFVDNFSLQSGNITGSIQGGGDNDSLTVNSASGDIVAWNISGADVGTVTGVGAGFSSIENITGGEGTDNFTFSDTGSIISGLIDGGASASDTLDLSILTAGVAVELGSTVTSTNPDSTNMPTNIHVNNIETISAANDANESDSNDTEVNNWLTVSDTTNLTWTVTDRNGGQVFPTSNPSAENTVNFVNFGTIIGGDGDDTFGLDGANAEITGRINGGGGDNRLDFSRVIDLLVVTIGDDISGTLNISNVQGVTGNNNAILRIDEDDDRTNTWTIDGVNRGRVTTEANGSSDFTFTAFNNLVGGGGQDFFNFTGAGNIEGSINGGGFVSAVDTIDATASSIDLQIQLSQLTQATLGDGSTIDVVADNGAQSIDISGVGEVIGGATRNNTFVGFTASDNTWIVMGQNSGEVNGVTFSNFANLTGGGAQDTFRLNNNDNISGVIDGGAGTNDLLQMTNLNNDVVVALGTENAGDLNVLGIETIDANAANNNTIIGDNNVNRWLVNGQNSGQIGTIQFSGFANLTGGSQDDTFILDGNDSITGVIDGGAEPATGSASDVVDLTGLANNISVALDLAIMADINATRVENINANTANTNTIIAANTDNSWQINAQNSGQINSAVNFSGFGNLTGGNQNDTFVYLDGGAINGAVDGGGQTLADIVDMSAQTSVRIRIGDPTQGFNNIEAFVGNDRDSELTAANVRNDWVLNSGNNSGVINGDINFRGFNILIGGSDVDNFNVANGSVSGEIRAGAGNDTLTVDIIDGVSGNVSFVGNDGTDTVTVRGGSASELYTTNYNVSPTNNRATLEYTRNSASTVTNYDVNYSETETVNDQVFSNQLVVNDIDGQADIFNLADGSFNLNSFAQVNYFNKENIRILAETGDVVNVDGPVQISNVFELVNASVNAVGADAQIRAAEVIFNGTDAIGSASDRLSLDTGRLSLQTVAGDVFISEENDVQLSSILNPTGVIDIVAGGNISDEGVLASNQAIHLTSSAGNIVLDNANNFAGDINLAASQGSVSLTNNRATQLGNIVAQTFNVTSGGALFDSGNIDVSGLTTINAANNAVELDSTGNDFGSIVITNASQVSIVDSNDIIIRQSAAAGAFSVQSEGNLTTDGTIEGADISLLSNSGMIDVGSQLSAQNTINLNGQGVRVSGNIDVQQNTSGNAVSINAGADTVELLGQINATTTSGGDISIEGGQITQQSGSVINGRDVALTSANIIAQNGNISASQNIQLLAQSGDINVAAGTTTQGNSVNLTATNGNIVSGQISAQQLTVSGDSGNVNIAANTTVGGDATISGNNAIVSGDVAVTGNLNLTSAQSTQLQANIQAGQADITATNGEITMADGSRLTTTGNISLNANQNITLSELEANGENITLVSNTGSVGSVAGSQTNIRANDLTVTTETGVEVAGDALGLSVASLTLNNNTGSVSLVNDQEIRVVQLRSNNDVTFINTAGDVVFDNTPDEPYLFEGTNDARVAGGVANANFDVGTLDLNVTDGAVRAIGPLNTLQPDLVGFRVTVLSQGFGVNGRPIVVLAKEELVVNSLTGFLPIFANGISPNIPFQPGNLTDLSSLIQGRNDLLVNVEAAEEIDPAVFTGVRNYSYDNISIRLPRDQLFEEDEELNEEEEDSFL